MDDQTAIINGHTTSTSRSTSAERNPRIIRILFSAINSIMDSAPDEVVNVMVQTESGRVSLDDALDAIIFPGSP